MMRVRGKRSQRIERRLRAKVRELELEVERLERLNESLVDRLRLKEEEVAAYARAQVMLSSHIESLQAVIDRRIAAGSMNPPESERRRR